jgi:hypothetical protein
MLEYTVQAAHLLAVLLHILLLQAARVMIGLLPMCHGWHGWRC